jgi:hypothetical protein
MQYGAGGGMAKLIAEAGGLLLGRRTYEISPATGRTRPRTCRRSPIL